MTAWHACFLWVDCHNEPAARRVFERLIDQLGGPCSAVAVEPYHKGGFALSWAHASCSWQPRGQGCISMRMPRMQVYLPDELYKVVKARGLPASELLQKAVRAEVRRLDLLVETDRYVGDLIAEVGPPTAAQRARAGMVAARIARRPSGKAG